MIVSGCTCAELERALSSGDKPLPAYRAKQIFYAISQGAASFNEISVLPKDLRTELASRHSIRSLKVLSTLEDTNDGSRKFQLETEDGCLIESVLMRPPQRNGLNAGWSACLSTQVGCPCGCIFCKTGTIPFARNLSTAEIYEQFLLMQDYVHKEVSTSSTSGNQAISGNQATGGGQSSSGGRACRDHKISSIVIMGMGEPLLNLDNLLKALSIITDEEGTALSSRHITISTCGILSGIRQLAEASSNAHKQYRLALSLSTADEALRNELMPISRQYSMADLRSALVAFQQQTGKRITLEMPIFKGVNTRPQDAELLEKFIYQKPALKVLVNLIPWNPFEGSALQRPSSKEINRFMLLLESRGIKVSLRISRGKGLGGACGQLGVRG
ncbi:MAG: 23S rRNA (adenine(2503)-C(2))-methyltransferase RlmN [Spirochaetaceae bacterium]|jgi:23S rRNA (adenine2503-C2)-methyltransferase|nr:23S rRNA (adenine(2503)-C(2))-methyltransferase RlmN [Spirochaetaceae bacterium]